MIYRTLSGMVGAAIGPLAPLAGAALRERLALDGAPRVSGGVWVHGASVGELNSARAVIEILAKTHPVLVTANTETGRAVVRGWGLPVQLAPLDVPQAVARFLDAARPALAVTVENEIWPNRAAVLRAGAVPQAVIGARMSARSARGWARARALIGPVMAGIDMMSAQDADTESRLVALGLPCAALAPRVNLKLIGPAATVPPPEHPARGRVWLAASTHPGEEVIALAAHAALRARNPGARLILAPRHPHRAGEVAALIAAQGLGYARLGDAAVDPGDGPPVLLIDRLGAMAGAYAAAGICLTGGSLADHGGHTPWEPAAFRAALLHGPHVANFAADYAALDGAGAAHSVPDGAAAAASLADRLAALMADDAARRAMGMAARAALDAAAPDPAHLAARLIALIGR